MEAMGTAHTKSGLVSALETLDGRRADETVLRLDGVDVTGAALDRLARVHAARLIAAGLRPGDRVALGGHTSIEGVAALIAHLRLGLVHVPLNTRYQPPERAHVLSDSGAHDLGDDLIVDDDGDRDATGPLAAWPEAPAAEAIALIVYTSGTTGRAKGVMLSHRALAANLGAMMALWRIDARDTVSHALPLFHVHGLGLGLLGPLLVGARARLHARFSPAAIIADVDAGASVVMAVPTMYHTLLEHLDAHPEDGTRLARARLFTAGSAALSAANLARFAAATGHVILERYGMTETLFTLSNPYEGERRPGSVGLPVPGVEVRGVDDEGRPIAPDQTGETGETGEIWVRGEGLMSGYWNNPEATASAFTDGWFRTGDVAIVDPDGYHRIVGRMSTDIIKSGGFKIGAREIEEVLAAHPDVHEVAVVGLADERWGEVVAAAVVPHAGREAGLAPALEAWCRERLADYKRPRRWVVAQDLPRNAMGKVVKTEVRALLADERAT